MAIQFFFTHFFGSPNFKKTNFFHIGVLSQMQWATYDHVTDPAVTRLLEQTNIKRFCNMESTEFRLNPLTRYGE